jgi:hypothetical protein
VPVVPVLELPDDDPVVPLLVDAPPVPVDVPDESLGMPLGLVVELDAPLGLLDDAPLAPEP